MLTVFLVIVEWYETVYIFISPYMIFWLSIHWIFRNKFRDLLSIKRNLFIAKDQTLKISIQNLPIVSYYSNIISENYLIIVLVGVNLYKVKEQLQHVGFVWLFSDLWTHSILAYILVPIQNWFLWNIYGTMCKYGSGFCWILAEILVQVIYKNYEDK